MFFKKKERFVVERKNIYAGEIIAPFHSVEVEISNERGNKLSVEELKEQGISNVEFFAGSVYRGILFKADENGLGQDLIYNTPAYPISSAPSKISADSKIIIARTTNLDKLLEYLEYEDQLTGSDLLRVFGTLITSDRWIKANQRLFGLIKLRCGGYCTGGKEAIPHDIYSGLSWITSSRNYKPHIEEQTSQIIKKIKY